VEDVVEGPPHLEVEREQVVRLVRRRHLHAGDLEEVPGDFLERVIRRREFVLLGLADGRVDQRLERAVHAVIQQVDAQVLVPAQFRSRGAGLA
jgi:hypothetical protein